MRAGLGAVWASALTALLALGALVGPNVAAPSPPAAAPVPVQSIRLGLSTVHLIRGERTVLVDAGSRDDLPALEAALAEHRVAWRDIAAVIITHGHSDHAGLAAEIRRRSGAELIIGRGDLPMAAVGRHDELKPVNFTARLIKRFAIDPNYEAFVPDLIVDDEIDLQRFGLGGRVRQMPGHTPGSLVIELDDGRAFVGDMMLGGWLGGALWPGRAGEHYFHTDRQRNRANIEELLRQPIHTFYLGHGGPVSRAAVLEGFELADPRPR